MKLDFDSRAKSWDDPGKIDRAKSFANQILKNVTVKKNMRALDYGCGTGLLSFELQKHFSKIILCDTSQGMLDVAIEKIQTQKISHMFPLQIQADKELKLDEQVDIVYTLMTLHHIHNIEKMLQNFFNLTKSGGYLCIADLDKEDGSFHSEFSDFDGHNGFDQQELKNLLRACGYTDVSSSIFYTLQKQGKETTKSFPLFCMIAKKQSGSFFLRDVYTI